MTDKPAAPQPSEPVNIADHEMKRLAKEICEEAFAQPAEHLAAPPTETKMLAELKRLLSNRDLVIYAPSEQWAAEWDAVTDELADW